MSVSRRTVEQVAAEAPGMGYAADRGLLWERAAVADVAVKNLGRGVRFEDGLVGRLTGMVSRSDGTVDFHVSTKDKQVSVAVAVDGFVYVRK